MLGFGLVIEYDILLWYWKVLVTGMLYGSIIIVTIVCVAGVLGLRCVCLEIYALNRDIDALNIDM